MYMNIGDNTIIDTHDIIAIFNINIQQKNIDIFKLVNKKYYCKYKSIILTKKEEKIYMYFSKFSPKTLQKRRI